jgi:hypothetical protein
MLRGTVAFVARIPDHRLSFPRIEYRPTLNDIEKIALESADGTTVAVTVYFEAIESVDEGERLATEETQAARDRIGFKYRIPIEPPSEPTSRFVRLGVEGHSIVAASGRLRITGGSVGCLVGLGMLAAEQLRADLETTAPAGERFYPLYRSALLSPGPVERFLHLYNLLLMLRPNSRGDDSQLAVDAFIRSHDPAVPYTSRPGRPTTTETVYTRLRTELGHPRPGVNLDDTKKAMLQRVGELAALVQRAIESS